MVKPIKCFWDLQTFTNTTWYTQPYLNNKHEEITNDNELNSRLSFLINLGMEFSVSSSINLPSHLCVSVELTTPGYPIISQEKYIYLYSSFLSDSSLYSLGQRTRLHEMLIAH